jgi:signal transduction histidine kinase
VRALRSGEAKSNRHNLPGASTKFVVHYYPDALRLDITDDGQAPPTTTEGSGHGLPGMRERVNLFGGQLDAGPGRDGGYSVNVRLPLQPAPS